MILAIENTDLYSYEIHSLIKAFYPGEDVKVLTEGSASMADFLNKQKKQQSRNQEAAGALTAQFRVDFQPAQILFTAGDKTWRSGDIDRSHGAAGEDVDYTCKSKACKDDLKHLLYDALAVYTGQQLPWGELIGIRPTKIAMTRLTEGESLKDAASFMEQHYLVSKEKAALAAQIADTEREILRDIHYEDGYSLYIGIPFCPTTCLYCSFPSFNIALWKDRIDDYLQALQKEIEETARMMEGKILDTIYIGGGTPTSLEAEQLDKLCGIIEANFDMSRVQEFTVEAGRPDSITLDKLKALRRHPVTRISINPQTMKEETLRIIGRRHSVQQVIDIFHQARECGFDNINMDLILGLPGENAQDVRNTTEAVKALAPDSLTVHSLAIKRASRLRQIIDEKGYPVLENTDETMEIAADAARKMGMEAYYLYRQKNMSGNFENVGYARPGKFGIYNILIMEEKQTIMALGAGSITKRVFPEGRIERCDNAKDVTTYIKGIDEMIARKKRLFS